jgi:hypothetical protein
MYKLIEKPNKELDSFKVTIVGDANDGDYVTTIRSYPKDKFEQKILPDLIELRDNYSKEYKLPDFETGWLDIPYGEYDCCHSLEQLSVEYTDKDGKVWNVEF